MNSSLMRLSRVLILFAVAGCAALPPIVPAATFQSRHGFLVVGNVTRQEVEKLDRILDEMEPCVVSAIHSIEVSTDQSRCPGAAGVCWPNGHILLMSYVVNEAATVWHEAAHAHHFARGCGDSCSCDFCSDWQKVAGKVYGDGKNGRYGNFWDYPDNGMVSHYSSKNYGEDIAEMTSDAYAYKTGRSSVLLRMKLGGTLDDDPRYAKKLKLLVKYGFISQELCDEILK